MKMDMDKEHKLKAFLLDFYSGSIGIETAIYQRLEEFDDEEREELDNIMQTDTTHKDISQLRAELKQTLKKLDAFHCGRC